MDKKSNIITWGNNHKRYIKNYEQAKLAAYYKAFYFGNVKLNGIPINRSV
jgi:hypothetical protein